MEGEFSDRYRVTSARLKNWDYSSPGAYFVTICVFNHNKLLGKVINGKMVLSRAGEIAKEYWKEIPKHFDNVTIEDFIIMPNHLHGIIRINNKMRRDVNEGCRYVVDKCRDVACNVSTNNIDVNIVNDVKNNDIKHRRDVVDKCRDVACNVSTTNENENNLNNTKNTNNTNNNICGNVFVPCRYVVDKCRDVACNVSTTDEKTCNVSTTDEKTCNVSTNNTNIENNNFMSTISPKYGSLPVIIRSFKSAVKIICNKENLFFAWQSRYYDEVIKDEEKIDGIRWYIRNNVRNWVKDKWYSK